MKDFDQNILPHFDTGYSSQGSPLPRRMVYQGGQTGSPGETPTDKAKEAPKGPELDINSPDFDNKYFSPEKRGDFQKNLDQALTNILKKIPGLQEKSPQFLTLKNDFTSGLIQSLELHKTSISQLFQKQYPTFASRMQESSGQTLWSAFQEGLSIQNCNSIGLVHDVVRDVTRFKFYAGNKEIIFPQADISIRYIPETVKTASAAREKNELSETKTVSVTAKEASDKNKTGAIDLFKQVYNGKEPQIGDRLLLDKFGQGTSKITAEFKTKNKENYFYSDSGTRIWLHSKDQITFTPKAALESPKTVDKVEIQNGTEKETYIVPIQIDTDKTYLELAKDIIEKNSIPAGLNQIIVDQIRNTGVNAEEYAHLLQLAHLAVGKQNRLPIVVPRARTERKVAQDQIRLRQEAESERQKRTAAESRSAAFDTGVAIAVVRQTVGKNMPEVEARTRRLEQELAGAKNKKETDSIWEDYRTDIDDDFSTAGISRSISDRLVGALRQGKERGTWREMWSRENPTVKKVVSLIKKNPDVFGKLEENSIRDKVYDLIWTGEAETFDSEDIINVFGLKLPYNWDYDQVLPMALIDPGKTKNPTILAAQKKCRAFIDVVEGLGNAIALLDPAATTDFVAGSRNHEKLPDDSTPARNLKTIIDLLMVSSSGKIEKSGEKEYSCNIEKSGKRLKLTIEDTWNGQYIVVRDPETNEKLFREFDHGGFDAEDYVEKINSLFSATARTRSAEILGEGLPEYTLSNTPTYFSLRDLETLNQSIPGIPVGELLYIRNEKEEGRVQNNLTDRLHELLRTMGIYGDAKFVDTAENIREIEGNDSALINIRYKGKDLTMKVINATIGWDVYLEYGFNRQCNQRTSIHAYDTKGSFNLREMYDGINKSLHETGTACNADMMLTDNTVERTERITIGGEALNYFNSLMAQYDQSTGYRFNHQVTPGQLTELIFRLYSFDELKRQQCVYKVAGTEKSYIVAKLPQSLEKILEPQNKLIVDLIYAIKNGTDMANDQVRHITKRLIETARENVNYAAKYERLLKRIFAYGLTDFDSEGRKVDMGDVDSETRTAYTKDEFFRKASGKAAYNDIWEQVRIRDQRTGQESIDTNKLNQVMYNLYLLGLKRLETRARKNSYYRETWEAYKRRGAVNEFDLENFDHIDNTIIRLGYLADTETRETKQNQEVNKNMEQMIGQILTLLPDPIIGPHGEKLTKEEAATGLRMLPISVLGSYSYNRSTDTHAVGLHTPIILDVFSSPYAKLILVPGLGSRGLSFAVGVAFTSRGSEWSKESRVSLYGAVTTGVTVGPKPEETGGGWGLGATAAVGGGIDFNIIKADDQDNFNYYMGFYANVGVSTLESKLAGINFGLKVIEWEIDAKQKYKNDLDAKLSSEGIKGYMDRLKEIYKKGSPANEVQKFCSDLKNDQKMKEAMQLEGLSDAEILYVFEDYVAMIITQFNEDFKLPLILGGEIKAGVTEGAVIAAGAATGNAPLLIGGVAVWAAQILISLKFNVASRMVLSRSRKTSEETMGNFGELRKQQAFDRAFADLPKSEAATEAYRSGPSSLDSTGHLRTGKGEVITTSASQAESMNSILGKIADFNLVLAQKGIDIQLLAITDNNNNKTIEVKLLDNSLDINEKILIAPGIVTMQGKRMFIKDPNSLQYLFIDQQTRKYPLETSHGATMERVVTISQNPYFSGDRFPAELTITRLADQKDTPLIAGNYSKEAPTAYQEKPGYNFDSIRQAQSRMAQALDKSGGEQAEKEALTPEREKLIQDHKRKIFLFRGSERKNFVEITNEEAKENLNRPDYVSERLYKLFDEYAAKHNIAPGFTGYEKKLLTLELSTLRYTNLYAGRDVNAFERTRILRERLEWCRKVLVKYFERRMTELQGKVDFKGKTPEELSRLAMKHLEHLDTRMPRTPIEPGTSMGVIIGVGGNAMHQLLDGSDDAKAYDDFWPIIGKDYTEAIRSGQPPEEYMIGMLLRDQLSHLPARTDIVNFMNSNLARKLASNGGLAFVLEPAEYETIISHYNNPAGTTENSPGLKKFMDLVEQVRKAQTNFQELISVKGRGGADILVKINTHVRSGIFNKCGNYMPTITEDITIIPPPPETATLILAANTSEARTTITTQAYKEFIGLMGGVTAAVSLVMPEEETGTPPAGEKPAGSGGEVGGSTGSGQGGKVELPDTSGTGTAEGSPF